MIRKTVLSLNTAERVILPNAWEAERITYDPTGWCLLETDDEYWLYPVEEINSITWSYGAMMTAHLVGKPYMIWKKSEYEYVIEDNGIVIKERIGWCKSSDTCTTENSDNVSHPPHYADGWSNGAEVIDLTENLSFCAGNVVKYVCRAGRKDPDKYVEDLKKARWYLDREIARAEED